MLVSTNSSWFVSFAAAAAPSIQLFAFPYSGGSAASYAHWRERLLTEVELVGVQLPGRASRMGEPLLRTMDALTEGLFEPLAARLYRPYVLFGHSNGALMAFSMLNRILHTSLPRPLGVVLSGKSSPTHAFEPPRLSRLAGAHLIEKLRTLAGTPPDLLYNEELMNLVAPILRADFALGESFRFADVHPGIAQIPALVMAGAADETPVESVFAWSDVFGQSCMTAGFEGGHFFINDNPAVLTYLNAFLARVAVRSVQASCPRTVL
jgi:medium-chain acyl-[acyl-carrier-protein] hydrolase